MQHIHGPNCGCKDIAFSEENEDLLSNIFIEKVVCLNELEIGSCKKIFKTLDNKFDKLDFLSSNDDPELLLIVPFDSNVKLKTVSIIAKDSTNYPNKMKLFINQENVDFNLVQDQLPIQEFDIVSNLDGLLEYSVKQSKFSNVSKLILFLTNENYDKISISYLGLKGIKTNMKTQIVNAVYESKPMLADHKQQGDFLNKHQIN